MMLKDNEIIKLSNEAYKAIEEELTKEIVNIIANPIADICKDTYLEKHAYMVLMMFVMMFNNQGYNWFTFRWAVKNINNKDKHESATYDNGRWLGLYQGISLAISTVFNKVDYFIGPQLYEEDKDKPLSSIIKALYDDLEDKVYLAFKKLYDKEMAKYNIKPKDLYQVLQKGR